MRWFRGIFKTKEEGNDDRRDFEAKILDIRRRIEEQREQLARSEIQPIVAQRHEEILGQTQSVDTTREKKNAELDAIKAKLLGKKQ
jgi:hypothetical protein